MNTSSSKKKTLNIVLIIIAIVLLTAIVGGYEFIKMRVPQMDGEVNLKNLSAPVTVLRDQNGIPHITASNNLDAFRTLGYIMASERLFQMEISRRLAKGELAEVIGEKALASDKLFRNLGLKSESEKSIQKKLAEGRYDPEMLAEMNAYYDGVNQFVATGPMPIEFSILGIKPKPFSAVDGQSFVGLMGFSFGVAIMTEPLLTKLTTRIGGDLVDDLRNEKIPEAQSLVVKYEGRASEEVLKVIAGLEKNSLPLFEGSNGWLLAGKRTKSGSPILANDPHISYSHPGVWFEAHIKTPTYETYGHFLALLPFPVLAHSREKAWGLTMSLTDDMDIYKENIDPKTKTYLFKGEKRPLIAREEVIKVKNASDFKMTVYTTHHGPILDETLADTTKDKSLALQWPFYDTDNDPLTSIFKMGRAKNMEEFKAAVSTGKSPGLNILYADKNNIGWWIFGEIWKKRPGIRTDFLLNGENGNDEILGTLSFNEKPHLENPVNGAIVSANTRPKDYPKNLRGDWQPDDRYKTIEAVIAQKEKWSPEEVMELQSLGMNLENKLLLAALLSDTQFRDAAEKAVYLKHFEILKNWNLISEIDSIAPSIYYTWAREIEQTLLKDLSDNEREIFAKTPNGWIFYKRVVLEKDSAWWKKYPRGDIFRQTFVQAINILEERFGKNTDEWKWGKLHTLEFGHPIGRVKPLNYLFNLGPYPAPGASHEVNNQKSNSFKGDFEVKAGPSTRRIIDMSHPQNAWGVLPIGNSGHMLSPFYSNQVKLFLSGKYRPELMDLNEQDVRFNMTFKPIR